MCGVFALLSRNYMAKYPLGEIFKNFSNIYGRGPDSSKMLSITNNLFYGFHRLAIVDLSYNSDQPLKMETDDGNQLYVICNGEIYNHEALESEFGFKNASKSDCEVIMHLYNHFGDINEAANRLDGVFAFMLYDAKKDVLFVGRDPIGVRPMFMGMFSVLIHRFRHT